MIKVDESIIIQRAVEEVFAFVADQRNAPEWQAGLLEVRRTDEGPLGVGATHAVVRKFMGRRMEVNNEYVTYDQRAGHVQEHRRTYAIRILVPDRVHARRHPTHRKDADAGAQASWALRSH